MKWLSLRLVLAALVVAALAPLPAYCGGKRHHRTQQHSGKRANRSKRPGALSQPKGATEQTSGEEPAS